MRAPILRIAVVAGLVPMPSAAQRQSVDDARWLVACWEQAAATRRVIERWVMSGMELKGDSRTLVGGRETEGERLRIFADGDTLVYDARPATQAPTQFRATSVSATELVFENPRHDFPQKISYRRAGPDSLIARIEGDRAGRRAPLIFPYRRVDCAGVSDSPAEVALRDLQPLYADLASGLKESGGYLNAWFVKHGSPGFEYVIWASAGYRPPTVSKEALDRSVQAMRSSPTAAAAAAALSDREHEVTIERSIVRGDTAELLVASRSSWQFPDASGRYGPAGERHLRVAEDLRVDRWIRTGSGWQLATASVIGTDVFIDGKLVSKNGKATGAP